MNIYSYIKMKIAVASKGKTENSEISELGGRAPFYLIFENKKLIKLISNPFKSGNGAGYSVGQMLSNEKVDLVICGKFGPVFSGVLKEKGINTKTANGLVKEVI